MLFRTFQPVCCCPVGLKPPPSPYLSPTKLYVQWPSLSLAATSYLLIDGATGQILAEHNSNMQVEPASLTKLMTAYILEQQIKPAL